jgi:hypothetical protein
MPPPPPYVYHLLNELLGTILVVRIIAWGGWNGQPSRTNAGVWLGGDFSTGVIISMEVGRNLPRSSLSHPSSLSVCVCVACWGGGGGVVGRGRFRHCVGKA